MAKEKISVSVDPTVLADADADAKAAGLNRSELIERTPASCHRWLGRLDALGHRPPDCCQHDRLRG